MRSLLVFARGSPYKITYLKTFSVDYSSNLEFNLTFWKCHSTSTIVKCLKTFGVKKEEIFNYPKLFNISKKELNEKSAFLHGKVSDADDVLSLFQLPLKDILKYLQIKNNKQKITDLSSILKCSESEACQFFVKHKFLLRSKMSTIEEKINTMLDGGVSMDDVRKDLWVLTYTREHIRSRIKVATKLNICPVRPWMLRCKEQVLYRAKSNKEENLLAMAPHASAEEYLCDRLGLSCIQYKSFVSKYPAVARVQVSKLKELLDFLLYEGFTTAQISQTPRILCHSVHTIKERLVSLRENNYNPQSLSVLCRNKKKFDSFLLKLKIKSHIDIT